MNLAATTGGPLIPVLFFVGVLALMGVGIFFGLRAEKKRTAALFEVATRLGLNFVPKVSNEEAATLGTFHLFNVGHSRRGKNLMRGKSEGAEIVVLDYQYTVGGGKSSHTYSQTVAIYPASPGGAELPDFTLAPEHWWDKLGNLITHRDINFEASEEFSQHYVLKGPDEARIRALFGADPLGFFAQHQGWSVESAGGALAVYHFDKRTQPEQMQPFLADTGAVRRTLVRD